MYRWSKKSRDIIITVKEPLQIWAEELITQSLIDLSIPEWGGKRTAEYQNELFRKGWSKADGYEKKSNHQSGNALDVCAFSNGKQSFNQERLGYIGGLGLKVWEELKESEQVPMDLYLHWGGLWYTPNDDPSGLGWDLPHFELKDYKQIPRI